MWIYIKHMKSSRCSAVVTEELNKLGLQFKSVELGEVELTEDPSIDQLIQLNSNLKKSNLRLIVNQKRLLVEKIKEIIHQLVYSPEDTSMPTLSYYISNKVNKDYNYISKTFSGFEGSTIENYFREQRINRVKELLTSNELSFTDISYNLSYSSVAHLSSQFKKVTGYTLFQFKQLSGKRSINQTS